MSSRQERLAALLADLRERRERGESVDVDALAAEHPDLADDLRSHMAFDGLFDDVLGGGAAEPGLPAHSSVLERIESMTGERARVLLRDVADEHTPMLRVPVGSADEDAPRDDSRYRVAGELARGGVGIVYKARDRDIGREVALKLLHRRHAGDEGVLARFVEEAQIGAQLQHPGIVPVYGLGMQEPGRPYFAMKLIKGMTLAEALAEGQRDAAAEARLLDAFEQLCQTVAYAHARGVIHRDLKPANVMLGSFGEVMVVDWGFGKVLGREEPTRPKQPERTIVATVRSGTAGSGSASIAGSVMGTPGYMPPEQALGQIESLDERCDVFALGAILCEILTGDPPYTGDSQDRLVQAAQGKLDDAYARLDACGGDEALVGMCRKALSAVPSERYPRAGALAEEIAGFQADAERRAREAEVEAVEERAQLEAARRHTVWEGARRRRTRWAMAASAAAVLIGVGSWAWRDQRDRERAEAARPAVERELEQAARLAASGKWEQALTHARTAEARAADADTATRARAGERLADLEREKKAAEEEAALRVKDEALLAALRAVRDDPESVHIEKKDAGYLAAFGTYGIGESDLLQEAMAQRMRTRGEAFATEVASFLDDWGWHARYRPEQARFEWQALVAQASALDKDPWRMQVRHATAEYATDRLVALARETEEKPVPPTSALLLSGGLRACQVDRVGLEVLTAALKHHPGNRGLLLACFFLEETPTRQLRWAVPSLALAPESATAWNQVQIAFHRSERAATALSVARAALERCPDDPLLWNNHDVSVRDVGSTEELRAAIKRFEVRAGQVGHDAELARIDLKKMRDAVAAEERIAKLRARLDADPQSRMVRRELAIELAGRRPRLAEAIPMLRTLIDEGAEDAELHKTLGWAFYQEGSSEGIAAFRDATRLAPTVTTYWRLLAAAQSQAQDQDAAIEAAREAVRVEPERANNRLVLGDYLRWAGEFAAAGKELLEARRLNPQGEGIDLRIGFAYAAMNRAAEACAAYRREIARKGGWEGYAHLALGKALLSTGGYAEAREELLAAELMAQGDRAAPFRTEAARFAVRDEQLSAVLSGKRQLGGPRESLELLQVCEIREAWLDGARLAERVIDEVDTSVLEGDERLQLHVSIAHCMSEAATGHGPQRARDPEERALLRGRALAHLRSALAGYADDVLNESLSLRYILSGWRYWYAGVYGEEALAKLPAEEAEAWRAFWRDVDTLLERLKEFT